MNCDQIIQDYLMKILNVRIRVFGNFSMFVIYDQKLLSCGPKVSKFDISLNSMLRNHW